MAMSIDSSMPGAVPGSMAVPPQDAGHRFIPSALPGYVADTLILTRRGEVAAKRCLIRSDLVARILGNREALVAARHLIGVPGISVVRPDAGIAVLHLLLQEAELVFSDGAITESLSPAHVSAARWPVDAAPAAMRMLTAPGKAIRPARQALPRHVARALVQRSHVGGTALVEQRSHATEEI